MSQPSPSLVKLSSFISFPSPLFSPDSTHLSSFTLIGPLYPPGFTPSPSNTSRILLSTELSPSPTSQFCPCAAIWPIKYIFQHPVIRTPSHLAWKYPSYHHKGKIWYCKTQSLVIFHWPSPFYSYWTYIFSNCCTVCWMEKTMVKEYQALIQNSIWKLCWAISWI